MAEDRGTLIISESHMDIHGNKHTNQLYRKLDGTLRYFHNDEELWMCPYARWWSYMLCCQVKFDMKDEVPVSEWIRNIDDKGIISIDNPRVINSKCDCVRCPDSWEECKIACNLLKENK